MILAIGIQRGICEPESKACTTRSSARSANVEAGIADPNRSSVPRRGGSSIVVHVDMNVRSDPNRKGFSEYERRAGRDNTGGRSAYDGATATHHTLHIHHAGDVVDHPGTDRDIRIDPGSWPASCLHIGKQGNHGCRIPKFKGRGYLKGHRVRSENA